MRTDEHAVILQGCLTDALARLASRSYQERCWARNRPDPPAPAEDLEVAQMYLTSFLEVSQLGAMERELLSAVQRLLRQTPEPSGWEAVDRDPHWKMLRAAIRDGLAILNFDLRSWEMGWSRLREPF